MHYMTKYARCDLFFSNCTISCIHNVDQFFSLSTGMFGSGVLSYFVLLRWLFLLNIVILLLTIFFLFIPQVIHENSVENNNASFSGWEMLTGEVRQGRCQSWWKTKSYLKSNDSRLMVIGPTYSTQNVNAWFSPLPSPPLWNTMMLKTLKSCLKTWSVGN